MTSAFSPAMQAALDGYDIPALPDGFADRLVARASAEAALEPARPARRNAISPWKRARRIVGSIAAFGFFSATAAATGLFGDPIEIPVFSDVARQLEIIEQPRPVSRAIAATPANGKSAATRDAAELTQTATGTDEAARQALERIVDDPRFKNLTPRQKRFIVGRQARKLVRSGEATRSDIRSAVRELRNERRPAGTDKPRASALRERLENATPEQKARLREKFEALPPEKQARIKERLKAATVDEEPVDTTAETAAPQISATEADDATAAETISPAATSVAAPTRQERRELLRDRYRNATPEQRARARERIRERRERAKRKPNARDRRAIIRRRRN